MVIVGILLIIGGIALFISGITSTGSGTILVMIIGVGMISSGIKWLKDGMANEK